MKAIRLHASGGAESLRFEDAPAPPPGPGEVRKSEPRRPGSDRMAARPLTSDF